MNMTENISSYKDLNLTRLKARYEYAKDLYNGKDIHVSGDDYTQAIDDEKRLKAHKIISSLYNDIAPYKKEILSDIRKYEEQHPYVLYRYGEPYDMLSTLTGIIKWYEEEAQYILEVENGNPKELPKELDTENAKNYFEKAISKKLMDEQYKWLKGLQLLSCFAQEMSDALDLGKGVNDDGSKRISWKPFEELFNIEKGKLRSNFSDIKKSGCYPSNIKDVKSIFE